MAADIGGAASKPDVGWLLRRLGKMTPAEIVLVRAPRGVRAAAERVASRLGAGGAPRRADRRAAGGSLADRLVSNDILFDASGAALLRALSGDEREALVAEADALAKGRITLFGETFETGRDVDWHRDPRTGASWPKDALATSIDYRRETRPADPKDAWELGRHQHLVRQALAFRLTGERRHADGVFRAVDSFLEQCAPGRGIHEASALEMARRAQSWILAFSILGPLARTRAAGLAALAAGELFRVAGTIRRRLSLYSSANNHLAGELAGLALLGLLFEPVAPRAARWRRTAVRLLETAADSLVLADGSGAERSPGYLAYVLDDLATVERALEREALPVPSGIAAARRRGRAFLEALDAAFRPGPFPRFGDEDGGFALGLPARGPGGLLSADLLSAGGAPPSPPAPPAPAAQRVFPDSGLVLHRDAGDLPASLLFDAGSLGFPPLYGHGHADALSFALSIGGRSVIVDPGTYAYYRGARWRSHFRGTACHATLFLDGRDQAEPGGAFLWESDVEATLLAARSSNGRFEAAGEHRGYRRLPGSPVVRRAIASFRNGAETIVELTDTVEPRGEGPPHAVSIAFPLDAAFRAEVDSAGAVVARGAGLAVRIEGPSGLAARVARGEDGAGATAGWQSRAFGSKTASATALFEGRGLRSGAFVTTIRVAVDE